MYWRFNRWRMKDDTGAAEKLRDAVKVVTEVTKMERCIVVVVKLLGMHEGV